MKQLSTAIFFAAVLAVGAADKLPDPVQPTLVSEVRTIKPGQTFTVGVRMTHQKGYHTYWQYPGTVGLATILNWELPEGFTVGETQWPVPDKTFMVVYDAYGYERDVTLLAEITAPKTLPRDPVTIVAKSGWMACSKKICCNVKFKELLLTLKTGASETDEAGAKMIAEARKELPKPVPGWSATAKRPDHKSIVLTVRGAKGQTLPDSKDVYLFPKLNYVDTTNPQTAKVVDNTLVIQLPLTEHAPEELKSVSALVYRPGGWPGTDAKYLPVTAKVEK